MLPWWVWIILLAIFANQIYLFSQCGCGGTGGSSGAGGGGSLPAIKLSGIQNITIVLNVATVFLGIAGYFYIGSNPQYERKYILFLLHGALFISVLSLTVTSLQQLNAVI